jgi:hypothetical protein
VLEGVLAAKVSVGKKKRAGAGTNDPPLFFKRFLSL